MELKTLETKRTRLRRIQLSDYDNMRILETEADIMKFTPSRIPQTELQTKTRLSTQISRTLELAPFGIWLSELKETGAFIGWFMLMPALDEGLELGFMIVKAQWKNGFASEIAQKLVALGFSGTKVKAIFAKTNVDNVASIRVLQKLGFEFEAQISVPELVFGGEAVLNSYCLTNPNHKNK